MSEAARLFGGLGAARDNGNGALTFAVRQLSGDGRFYVAKSGDGLPAFLIEDRAGARGRAPVSLRHLHVLFHVGCELDLGEPRTRTITATLLQCRSPDPEVQGYFLRVVELVLTGGNCGTENGIAQAIEVIASLFQRLGATRTREAQGLFGELLLIALSTDPVRMLEGWRSDPMEHFDFAWGAVRLEVKTSARRSRRHSFSAAQCSPPELGALASLFVERSTGGTTISDLVDRIARRVQGRSDLILKLQMLVATGLGADAVREVTMGFDEECARDSILLLDLAEIPAIRGELPPGVGEVRFTSDVANTPRISPELGCQLPL